MTRAEAYGKHSKKGASNYALWRYSSGYKWAGHFPIRPQIDWRQCPILFVDDSHQLGIPPGWLNILSRLLVIEETETFLTRLAKMSDTNQKAWYRIKNKLQTHITPGMDFKPWPKVGPNVYSVRVNVSVRAHLKRDAAWDTWAAMSIGGHEEMGHGP